MATASARYEGIIFDLDGVIRHWGDAHLCAAEARYGVARELILRATFDGPAFRDALTGRLPAEAWHEAARASLCQMTGRDVGGAVDEFVAYPGWIDRAMLTLVDSLRGRLRVGLLSNGTTLLERHLQLHDLDGHFDAIVNTARIGVAKPEPAAYRIAAERLGVAPGACIFIDDVPVNITGACAAGLTAILFTGLQPLRAELHRLGVVCPGPMPFDAGHTSAGGE